MATDNIYVLGAGSIGCLFSYYLRKYNNNVILITRDKKNISESCQGKEINFEKPLMVELKYKGSDEKSIERDIVNCLVKTPTQIKANNEKIKILLITTKSPDTLQAIQSIESSLDSQCVIILMQNGVLGTYSLLTEYFSNKYHQKKISLPIILTGTTSNGSYRISPLNIVHAGKGTTFIGEPKTSYTDLYHEQYKNNNLNYLQMINEIFTPLRELDITVYTEPQDYITKLLPLLQTKLVINSCLNPLTALFECLNGWIVDTIHSENHSLNNIDKKEHPCSKMLSEICQEAAWVLVEDDDDSNINMECNIELPITAQHLSEKAKLQAEKWELDVIDVAKKTALNRNSMLQDIDAKRAVTEIGFLNGYLVKEAQKKYERLSKSSNDNNVNNKTILKVNEMLVRLIEIKSWIRSQN